MAVARRVGPPPAGPIVLLSCTVDERRTQVAGGLAVALAVVAGLAVLATAALAVTTYVRDDEPTSGRLVVEDPDSGASFEVPADARAHELLLTERDPVTRLLIGHENSLLHRRIPFRITGPPSAPGAAVRG